MHLDVRLLLKKVIRIRDTLQVVGMDLLRQVEVGDKLLFSIENFDKNIYIHFVYGTDIDSEYDNFSD